MSAHGRRARRPGGRRRLDPDRRSLAPALRLARPDRGRRPRAPRHGRAVGDAGLDHEPRRRGRRPGRHRARVAHVLAPHAARAAPAPGADGARAQALLRRGCTTSSSTAPPSALATRVQPLGRGAGDRRLAARPRPDDARRRARPQRAADRARCAPTRSRSPAASPSSPSSSSRCADAAPPRSSSSPSPARSSSGCCRSRATRPARSPLLIALAEVGLWIDTAARLRLRRRRPPVQEQQVTWFDDLGVSYHVGLYGFSLWLIGMAVVVCAAAIALRASGRPRDRARAYFGLMLVLTGAIVGVFSRAGPARSSTPSSRRC